MNEQEEYPIGTIICYGPDDKDTTRLVASVISNRDEPPLRNEFRGEGLATDPEVLAKIGEFFKGHGVKKVVMSAGNVGCEHVAGVDYPVGEDCPFCPYWHGRANTST